MGRGELDQFCANGENERDEESGEACEPPSSIAPPLSPRLVMVRGGSGERKTERKREKKKMKKEGAATAVSEREERERLN